MQLNPFMRLLVTLTLLFVVKGAFAWVYPEHRAMTILAIQKLKADQRATLERMWAVARIGHEGRLTSDLIDVTTTVNPTRLDYASWMSIAGDHSCSPKGMLHAVLLWWRC